MTNDESRPSGFSLRRWSARKHEVRREGRRASSPGPDTALGDARPESALATDVEVRTSAVTAKTFDANGGSPVSPAAAAQFASPASIGEQREERGATAAAAAQSSRVSLPSIDTLSIDSDYSPFMQTGVDESLKRGALKKLFTDPRFNVMDGLDVYIDDYSKPDPIDPDIVRTLVQARYIFNPPATRVNEQGYVEDVQEDVPAKCEPDDADALRADREDADAVHAESQDADAAHAESQDADGLTRAVDNGDAVQREPEAPDRSTVEPEAADTLNREQEDVEAGQTVLGDTMGPSPLTAHRSS